MKAMTFDENDEETFAALWRKVERGNCSRERFPTVQLEIKAYGYYDDDGDDHNDDYDDDGHDDVMRMMMVMMLMVWMRLFRMMIVRYDSITCLCGDE